MMVRVGTHFARARFKSYVSCYGFTVLVVVQLAYRNTEYIRHSIAILYACDLRVTYALQSVKDRHGAVMCNL